MDHQRGTAVLGKRLKRFRKLRGWTQQELADRSGYCDRLIRKAERGGPISMEALQVLAMTLCDDGLIVTANDLNGSSRASIEYLQCLLQPTSSFVLLDGTDLSNEDVFVDCCRVGRSLPIYGRFSGQSAFTHWCHVLRLFIVQHWVESLHCLSLVDQSDAFIHVQFGLVPLPDPAVIISRTFDFDLRIRLRDFRISEIFVLSDLKMLSEFSQKWKILIASLNSDPLDQSPPLPSYKSATSRRRRLLHGI